MKMSDYKYTSDDIITSDGYLNFCESNNICYIKTDFFYIGTFNWRGQIHPKYVNKNCVIGHSDYPITDNITDMFEKVFCINRCTHGSHVYALPLGITNDCDDSPRHRIYGDKKMYKKENIYTIGLKMKVGLKLVRLKIQYMAGQNFYKILNHLNLSYVHVVME
jgi:hypothetical protein